MMLKRVLIVLLSFSILLTGLTMPAQAAGLTKPERYEAALAELKNFLNDMGTMSLSDLSTIFDDLGSYQMSMPLTYYTMVLSAIESGNYDQVFYLTDILKQNTKFCEFLAEDGELGSLEDLELYAQGRREEMNGNLSNAVAYYQQCMWYRDSMDRVIQLEQSMLDAQYQEALSWYKQGTYEGYQRAYELFLILGDYKESQAYLQKASVLRVTPTPKPSPTATPTPTPTPTATPTPSPTPKQVSQVYYGTSEGFQGNIEVAVTMDNEKILAIDVLSHNEIIGKQALLQLPDQMIAQQTIVVDMVSGATYTSKGLLEAVADAVNKSPFATSQVYYGTGEGMMGDIEVAVTIDKGRIIEIDVLSHNETDIFFDMAIEQIPDKLIAQQMVDVDVVTGATHTSLGLIEAVLDALCKHPGVTDAPAYEIEITREYYYEAAELAYARGNMRDAFYNYLHAGDYSDARTKAMMCGDACIALGLNGALFLRENGTVFFVGTCVDSWKFYDNTEWKNIIAVSADFASDCYYGVREDGTVVCVGGSTSNYGDVVSKWRDIVAIDVGYDHVLGLKADGSVISTGNNSSGCCNVGNWDNVVDIEAGYYTSAAVTTSGEVLFVGDERYELDAVTNWRNPVTVSIESDYAIILDTNGKLKPVGTNSAKYQIVETWDNVGYAVASWESVVGLRADGTVYVYETEEGVFTNAEANASSWRNVIAVDASIMTGICAITADGRILCTNPWWMEQIDSNCTMLIE